MHNRAWPRINTDLLIISAKSTNLRSFSDKASLGGKKNDCVWTYTKQEYHLFHSLSRTRHILAPDGSVVELVGIDCSSSGHTESLVTCDVHSWVYSCHYCSDSSGTKNYMYLTPAIVLPVLVNASLSVNKLYSHSITITWPKQEHIMSLFVHSLSTLLSGHCPPVTGLLMVLWTWYAWQVNSSCMQGKQSGN